MNLAAGVALVLLLKLSVLLLLVLKETQDGVDGLLLGLKMLVLPRQAKALALDPLLQGAGQSPPVSTLVGCHWVPDLRKGTFVMAVI